MKNALLILISTLISMGAALAMIHYFAPGLLLSRGPVDLQLVQLDEQLPPFYAGVFRDSDHTGMFVNDPETRIRATPFLPEMDGYGGHDLLGFRNIRIPRQADVVVIGDSQTYGSNVSTQDNWPSRMQQELVQKGIPTRLMAMANGGWGAMEYLEMSHHAFNFKPRVMVVAFYTGNDPLDTFISLYGLPKWASRRNSDFSAEDLSSVNVSMFDYTNHRKLKFEDGSTIAFNPKLRLAANQRNVIIDQAYKHMLDVAQSISKMCVEEGVTPVITLIPTKELIYSRLIDAEGLIIEEEFRELINVETERAEAFAAEIRRLPGITFVDVIPTLQEAALLDKRIYPEEVNGHPSILGYEVLGKQMALALEPLLSKGLIRDGAFAVQPEKGQTQYGLKLGPTVRFFQSQEVMADNGWQTRQVPLITPEQFYRYEVLSTITDVDPLRFGPSAHIEE